LGGAANRTGCHTALRINLFKGFSRCVHSSMFSLTLERRAEMGHHPAERTRDPQTALTGP
jgi:isopentenyldiphosphate isomerase